MIILDTNVLSAMMVEPAELIVAAWLDEQPRESVWTSSISVLEIRFGLEIMHAGRRREHRAEILRRLLEDRLELRIAPFDHDAAEAAATLMAGNRMAGTPRDVRDTMIAGIAVARGATLATRNVRHFTYSGLKIVDPWKAPRQRP
jgi:predicted nucleic acid-binding protein